MKVSFKDFEAYLFLGNLYEENVNQKVFEFWNNNSDEELISSFFEESVWTRVNSIYISSVLKTFNGKLSDFIDFDFRLETDKLVGKVDLIDWGSAENKEKGHARKIYIFSKSTKLKNKTFTKVVWLTKLLKLSNISFDSIEQIVITRKPNKIGVASLTTISDGCTKMDADFDDIGCYYPLNQLMEKGEISYFSESGKSNLKLADRFQFKANELFRKFDEFIEDIIKNKPLNAPFSEAEKVGNSNRWIANNWYSEYYKSLQTNVIKDYQIDYIKDGVVNNETILNDYSTKLISKKVLYDFETIGLPFSAFDNSVASKAYPLQYSVVKVNEKNELLNECINEVFDFSDCTISAVYHFFKKMIDDLYEEGAVYVAHHKSTENTAIENMIKLFADNDYVVDEETKIKSQHIIGRELQNSLDTETYLKKTFMGFPSYSLKFMNKWIAIHRPELNEKYGILNYEQDLEFKNGSKAQDVLHKLYFKMVSESDKEKYIFNLKKYCQNDVLSMLPLIDLLIEAK